MSAYDLLLSNIKLNASKNKEIASGCENEYINVDKLFNLFYHLFNSNNLLEDAKPVADTDKMNKFVFTEEYPDAIMTDGCTVTFEITRRECANLSVNTKYMSESHTQYRPMYLGEREDIDNGGVIASYMQPYDNEITLYCWSSKVKYARNIASLVENVLLVSYYFIRQKVGVFAYHGRYAPIIKTGYGEKNMVGIPIKILVRTYEVGFVKKSILDKLPQLIIEDIT